MLNFCTNKDFSFKKKNERNKTKLVPRALFGQAKHLGSFLNSREARKVLLPASWFYTKRGCHFISFPISLMLQALHRKREHLEFLSNALHAGL